MKLTTLYNVHSVDISNCQGRRPLDKKKKYIVGCQKSVTKPNAENTTSVRRMSRQLTKAKSTVQRSSVDFVICRVFKGHYELPKSEGTSMCMHRMLVLGVVQSKLQTRTGFKKVIRSRSDLGSAEHFQRSRSDRYRAHNAI